MPQQEAAASSVLDGITTKTNKAELMGRLRDAAKRLARYEDAKVSRLQEIEERVRARYTGRTDVLQTILVTSTPDEWREAVDFLENFEDLLPPALRRLHDGAQVLLEAEGS